MEKILNVIEKSKNACEASKNNTSDHFSHLGKMVNIGSNTKRKVEDYKLSMYACYLIVMNGDSRKDFLKYICFKKGF